MKEGCEHDKKLKVMADFMSSGLWCGECGVMMPTELFNTTPELEARINTWIKSFDKEGDEKTILRKDKEYIEQLNGEGRQITEEMGKLNPDYEKVFYHAY